MSYVDEVIDLVVKKNPAEPEFHQAVKEVLESLRVVIEANEGSCPYKKATTDEEIEEERRLFYVAMTRAKRKLVISYVKEKNGKDLLPSRFVSELLLNV